MTNQLKYSKYNFLFTYRDHSYLYNCETNFFCQLPSGIANAIKNNCIETLPTDIVRSFQNAKVLLNSANVDDYFYKELYKFNSINYNPTTLNLIIAPTTGCNFKCPYCFEETKRPITMSQQILDELINFIRTKANTKYLNITWYGGEPLLAIEIIEAFHRELKKLKIKIISQNIITNGYLLTERNCSILSNLGITKLQITLDGLQENNDRSRILTNGKGTFNVIYSNIRNILNNFPDFKIALRVNINKNNIQNFYDIQDLVKKDFKDNNNISVYPGILKIDADNHKSLCSECFSSEDLYSLHQSFKNRDFNLIDPLKKKYKGCLMHTSYGFLIGPAGDIYKCWSDLGKEEKIIGYIQKPDLINPSLLIKYALQSSPFEDECQNCIVFPICSGGCSLDRYRNKFENSKFEVCSPLKDPNNLKDAIISEFLSK